MIPENRKPQLSENDSTSGDLREHSRSSFLPFWKKKADIPAESTAEGHSTATAAAPSPSAGAQVQLELPMQNDGNGEINVGSDASG